MNQEFREESVDGERHHDSMNNQVARRLDALTEEFYQRNAVSFDATRQSSWPGWSKCLEAAGLQGQNPERLKVLDVAAGNLRFARFLNDAFPDTELIYTVVDSCEPLLANSKPISHGRVNVQVIDLIEELLKGNEDLFSACGQQDLAVCFGFLHHTPTEEARIHLLQSIVEALKPGGIAAISFWRFMEVPSLAKKTQWTTQKALQKLCLSESDLDQGDYLLGWGETSDSWRYCHNFNDAELKRYCEALTGSAELVQHFRSDGRPGDLNSYLVLRA